MLRIAHRLVANRIDIRLSRDFREALRSCITVRIGPIRTESLERGRGKIDHVGVDGGAKYRLRGRTQAVEPRGIHQEAPAPKSQFGAGGALLLRSVPDARVGRRAKPRTDRR